nr:EOG090X0DK3 [Lepidurus arcticus]
MSDGFNINMADSLRKFDSSSPKSSPRGSRSPVVPRQDSSGTLKTTISLGKNPSIVHTGPFYLLKDLPSDSELTGATNLMAYYNLEHSYNKFTGKKVKDSLSSFLPNLPGMIDTPGHVDNSSLRSLIEKPPIGGKELAFLHSHQLAGFRLHPGPLPEQYRFATQQPMKRKHKHKKHKKGSDTASQPEPSSGMVAVIGTDAYDGYEKKHKKQKRHEEEKDRKKKKKEKKKKKQKHSPEHPGLSQGSSTGGSTLQHSNGLPKL